MTLKEALEIVSNVGETEFNAKAWGVVFAAASDMLALAEARGKATQGDWTIFNGSAGISIRRFTNHANKIQICGLTKAKTVRYRENADFIVTAANLAQKWGE